MYHVGIEPNPTYAPSVPFILVFAYQMMFAIITPALMTGAFVGRFRFGAYLIFIALWTIIVYLPAAHWIWGGGFLAKLGVVDFAGGIVIHTAAGFSALATAKYLGKRKMPAGQPESSPASLPLVALGAGLLWFGWFGFNAGGAYAADALAAYAFTNTMLAGSIAMLVWMFWEWRETGRASSPACWSAPSPALRRSRRRPAMSSRWPRSPSAPRRDRLLSRQARAEGARHRRHRWRSGGRMASAA